MSTKENKKIILQQTKESNELGGDVSKIRPLMNKYNSPNFISHSDSGDMDFEQSTQLWTGIYSAFPDFYASVDDILAEDDKVALRCTYKCTHKGTFMGIPATGKQVVFKGVEIYKIAGKKVVECWALSDTLSLLTQLGVIPAPKS
jgi:predicted ester cyclase